MRLHDYIGGLLEEAVAPAEGNDAQVTACSCLPLSPHSTVLMFTFPMVNSSWSLIIRHTVFI